MTARLRRDVEVLLRRPRQRTTTSWSSTSSTWTATSTSSSAMRRSPAPRSPATTTTTALPTAAASHPPEAGRWWIGVNNDYCGRPVLGPRELGGTADRALDNGVPVDDYVSAPERGTAGSTTTPTSAAEDDLLVELTGLSADADLFVRYGAKPDRSNYDCISAALRRCRTCSIPGRRRTLVDGVNNYSPATVPTGEGTGIAPPDDFYTLTPCRVLDTRDDGHALPRHPRICQSPGLRHPGHRQGGLVQRHRRLSDRPGHLVLYPGDAPPPLTSTIASSPARRAPATDHPVGTDAPPWPLLPAWPAAARCT